MSDSMTPPPCPTCGRRASRRTGYVRTTDKMACIDPFHDAGDWGPTLLEVGKRLVTALDIYRGLPLDRGMRHAKADAGREVAMRTEKMRAIIAAAEGRKEEVHDDSK